MISPSVRSMCRESSSMMTAVSISCKTGTVEKYFCSYRDYSRREVVVVVVVLLLSSFLSRKKVRSF